MNKLEKAIQIALKAHEGQTDKGGNTYVLHPLRLMVQMPTEQLQTIAVLHDVVEDSAYTFEDLAKEGFPEEVISAIRALTKKEGEQYNDFINRVKLNPLAVPVKIADLKDNSNLDRIPNPTDVDLERVKKYQKVIELLSAD